MQRKIDYAKIGERVRLKREDKGLTRDKLSEKAGISSRYLVNIETNNLHSIGLQTLFSIATALDTTIDYFLIDNLEENKQIAYQEIFNMLSKMNSEQRIFTMDLIKFLDNTLK